MKSSGSDTRHPGTAPAGRQRRNRAERRRRNCRLRQPRWPPREGPGSHPPADARKVTNSPSSLAPSGESSEARSTEGNGADSPLRSTAPRRRSRLATWSRRSRSQAVLRDDAHGVRHARRVVWRDPRLLEGHGLRTPRTRCAATRTPRWRAWPHPSATATGPSKHGRPRPRVRRDRRGSRRHGRRSHRARLSGPWPDRVDAARLGVRRGRRAGRLLGPDCWGSSAFARLLVATDGSPCAELIPDALAILEGIRRALDNRPECCAGRLGRLRVDGAPVHDGQPVARTRPPGAAGAPPTACLGDGRTPVGERDPSPSGASDRRRGAGDHRSGCRAPRGPHRGRLAVPARPRPMASRERHARRVAALRRLRPVVRPDGPAAGI